MISLRSRMGENGGRRGHVHLVDDLRTTAYPVPTAQGLAGLPPIMSKAERRRSAIADLAYIVLTTTGWLAGNLLGILGCVVAMFIVISHGHIDTFFLHVDNLASRFNTADLGRRATFEHQLVQLFTVVIGLTLAVRGPVFVARLRRALREGKTS